LFYPPADQLGLLLIQVNVACVKHAEATNFHSPKSHSFLRVTLALLWGLIQVRGGEFTVFL